MIKYTVRIYNNGDKVWYKNGKLHREDGPAIECVNGDKKWILNGIQYSEEDYKERLKKLNYAKELTVKEVSDLLGYDVKIVK